MKQWISQPVSRTCEFWKDFKQCGKPTTHAYEAMGMGWMALCKEHAKRHIEYAKPITHSDVKAAGWKQEPTP